MKIIYEKDRDFVDRGKVKFYHTSSDALYQDGLSAIHKIVVLPEGKVYASCKSGVEYIFVMLTGELQLSTSGMVKESLTSNSILIVTQKLKRLTLRNVGRADAEYLAIVINRKKPIVDYLFQVFHQSEGYIPSRLLLSPGMISGKLLIEEPVWITKVFYNINDNFDYACKDIHNQLYIYVISGEVYVDGNRLLYNDSAFFAGLEKGLLVDFRKQTELLIIEKPI